MSGPRVIVALLKADAAFLAMVPAEGIHAGEVPQSASLPAVAYASVSTVQRPTIAGVEPMLLVDERMQITAAASSYPAKKAVLDAVRLAIDRQRGLIAGVRVRGVRHAGVGPDLDNTETSVFTQSIDFFVTYLQPQRTTP